MMINKNKEPIDYIVATEQCASVKEFATEAFKEVGFKNIEWRGEGVEERLVNLDNEQVMVEVDKELFRPGEVQYLRGSYDKIKKELGWKYEKDWKQLLKEMVNNDLLLAKREVLFLD